MLFPFLEKEGQEEENATTHYCRNGINAYEHKKI